MVEPKTETSPENPVEQEDGDIVEMGDVSVETKGAFGFFPDGGQGFMNI